MENKTILEMDPPKSIKDIHKLTGRIAALNQFVFKLADKCLPFFKMLRGGSKFTWDDNYKKAVDDLMSYLSSCPLLVSLEIRDTFLVFDYVRLHSSRCPSQRST